MNYEELKKAALQALGLTFAVGLGVALLVGAVLLIINGNTALGIIVLAALITATFTAAIYATR